jgi:hypothetical protein
MSGVQYEVVAHLTFRANSWLLEFPDSNGTVISTAVLIGRIPALKEVKTVVFELFSSYGTEFCTLFTGAFHVQILTLLEQTVPGEMDV